MTSVTFDHVVIGTGALGSAAAYWLARSGEGSVCVLEQFDIGHRYGASEDHSRIIRHAYHAPIYTALTPDAYALWEHIEEVTGLQLVVRTGTLELADSSTEPASILDGYRTALTSQGLAYEDLDAAAIRQRWPQFAIDNDTVGLFQPDGGILDIRRANAAHLALARDAGATVRSHAPVTAIEPGQSVVSVHTPSGTLTARSVTVCAGSWAEPLLARCDVALPLTLSQEQVTYVATNRLKEFTPDRFPVWIWHGSPDIGDVYGFPVYGEVGVKVARDMTARFVTQQTRSFDPDPAESELVEGFLGTLVPGAAGPRLLAKTCVYDMPPDRDFVLDRSTAHPNVTILNGAGHAAKFASLLGRVGADLTLRGETSYPIEPFRIDRPALRDPAFVPTFRLAAG